MMPGKVAIVVDALVGMGGAEKVLLSAMELFPFAPIYTMLYNPSPFANTAIAERQINTSFINRLPWSREHYRDYLPLMPMAVEQFDLSRYDLIISLSYAVAHGVKVLPGQTHISYTYTPMRYAWRNVPLRGYFFGLQWPVRRILNEFCRWDVSAVTRINRLGAISNYVASLIRNAYHLESEVIYPPVDVDRFHPWYPRDDYYVTVSRLVAHKRIDLIVEAFSALKLPLIVVGDGPEMAHLRRIASPNVTFIGYRDDAAVEDLLGRARAFIYASEEDFGIAMVEAQAAGCPVIAYGKGAALETVCEGETGLYFQQQSTDSLIDAVRRFERQAGSFNPRASIMNARRFNKERFKGEFKAFIDNVETAEIPEPLLMESSQKIEIVKSLFS
jgi:glycosyltransferase involved in cell wall biosynthesis